MIRVRSIMSGITLLALATTVASAQKGFGVGYTDIGPVLGLGSVAGASFSLGGRFERGVKALPDMGNGTLGFGVSADWYHYSQHYTGITDFSFTYIPIAATLSYHFNVTNKKVDPFIGLGLGYLVLNTSYSGVGGYDASGIFFAGRLGMRYFMSDKMALYGDVGAGGAALHVGVTFKMGGA